MPSYKCCGCNNILTPQGPIMALVSHVNGQDHLRLSFEDSGRINDLSLSRISSLTSSSQSKAFTMAGQETLNGSLANFTLRHASVDLDAEEGLQKAAQTITLCCSNCGSCCEYKTK